MIIGNPQERLQSLVACIAACFVGAMIVGGIVKWDEPQTSEQEVEIYTPLPTTLDTCQELSQAGVRKDVEGLMVELQTSGFPGFREDARAGLMFWRDRASQCWPGANLEDFGFTPGILEVLEH